MSDSSSKRKESSYLDINKPSLSNNLLQSERGGSLYLVSKRIIDIIGAFIGLVITLPLFLVISILYLFGTNKGPVFFSQERIGKGGVIFKIYKFRSMIVKAEQVLQNDKILFEKYVQNNYKLNPEEDPRITRVGRFLRQTSLDELPQLINVLKGDMSLVGPRPVIQDELKEYEYRIKDFFTVKPGVTGYWQICGRSDVSYPERADLEFYYIDNRGFNLDAEILLKTFFLVLVRKGAY